MEGLAYIGNSVEGLTYIGGTARNAFLLRTVAIQLAMLEDV